MGDAADRLTALGLAVLCLASYVATLTPGLAFQIMDGHELTLNAVRLGVAHPSGYPVYTWLGFLWIHLVPLGDAAYRMNLLSAVMAAVAVGAVFLLIRELGVGRLAAGTAAFLFGVSDTFWSQAVVTEVYTTNLAVQAATMLVLLVWGRRRRSGRDGDRLFLTFALLFGTSLGTHLSNLGFAPVYAAFVLAIDPGIVRRPRLVAGAVALFALASSQYVWLAIRGSAFDQFPNPQPDTWENFWTYTVGTATSARFAYPIGALPFRLVFYQQELTRNFTLAGVALGILGAWVAVLRSPSSFWLLFAMHLVNVTLFSQFAVPDPEVFFLPGYVAWTAFVACGVQVLVDGAAWLGRRLAPSLGRATYGAVATVSAVALLALWQQNVRRNDRSHDTLVPDFERNAYDLLPQGSALLAPRGVFGASILYWQVADGLRPDVTVLGQRGGPRWDEERPLLATLSVANGAPTMNGRIGRRGAGNLPRDAWWVPVLFGNARRLILSRVDRQPGTLLADPPATMTRIDRDLGPVTLVGAIVTPEPTAPTLRLHVESWWRVPDARRVVVSTGLDATTLEAHVLGLENLARYATIAALPPGSIVHEDFRVVVPSGSAGGAHMARLGVTTLGDGAIATEWMDVGAVTIP